MTPTRFSQLQAFLAVAQHGNFSRAARALGVSRSAVSQAVRQLEIELQSVLLARTTRSVSLTDAGRRLAARAGPAIAQAIAALEEAATPPGEVQGRLRLSVPHIALPLVIEPVLPAFRAQHPRVEVEISVEDRLVDIVAEGFDAGVRLTEFIERDMVQVRLTGPCRFVVVGAPSYLAQRPPPLVPSDLLAHECITFRASSGGLYAWELERGEEAWRIPVRGGVVTSSGQLCARLAALGLGLAYTFEPLVQPQLERGELSVVLEPYAAVVPGLFLYYPSNAQRSAPLRRFVELAKGLVRPTPPSPDR